MSTIAAFDFDGTLTYRDTFVPFLRASSSSSQFACKILCAFPPLFRAYCTQSNYRQACKEQLIARFFGGMPLAELQILAEQYANSKLPEKIRPEAMRRLRWHQKQNHRCVLISASPDIYLIPWAKQVGFELVLASQLAVDDHSRVIGTLQGLNCRGPEKTRRLQEALGPKSEYTLYAYGDSDGDKELLALADYPYYRQFPEGTDGCQASAF